MNRKIKIHSIFKNKFGLALDSFGVAIGFIFVQQLILASSSIWLAELILQISEGGPFLVWLSLYLLSLFLPYIPNAFALVSLSKSQVRSTVQYVQRFSSLYPGRISEWSNDDITSTKSSILVSESSTTISSYIEYLYYVSSYTINILLNILTLSFLIDHSLLIVYLLGIGLSLVVLHFQKKPKERLALKAQQSRIRWASLLLKACDNILLNNLHNLNLWKSKAFDRGKRLIGKTVTLEKYNQSISMTMAVALFSPSMILLIYLALTHFDDAAFLTILTVIIARLFQSLTFTYDLLYYLADFPTHRAKLNTVLAVIDPDRKEMEEEKQELLERVDWTKIQAQLKNPATPSMPVSPYELWQQLPQQGRITLQGDNGSGKTSLLLSFKAKHGIEAFYLPPKHELIFKSGRNRASTGQTTRKILEEIRENIQSPVILLDEWDANLDRKNRDEMSLLIDQLAAKKCVVEVLHRDQNGS